MYGSPFFFWRRIRSRTKNTEVDRLAVLQIADEFPGRAG